MFVFIHANHVPGLSNEQGIRPSIENVESVFNYPGFRITKQAQRFVDLASYFRRFVKNISILAKLSLVCPMFCLSLSKRSLLYVLYLRFPVQKVFVYSAGKFVQHFRYNFNVGQCNRGTRSCAPCHSLSLRFVIGSFQHLFIAFQ